MADEQTHDEQSARMQPQRMREGAKSATRRANTRPEPASSSERFFRTVGRDDERGGGARGGLAAAAAAEQTHANERAGRHEGAWRGGGRVKRRGGREAAWDETHEARAGWRMRGARVGAGGRTHA
jgi:hypothetical protein